MSRNTRPKHTVSYPRAAAQRASNPNIRVLDREDAITAVFAQCNLSVNYRSWLWDWWCIWWRCSAYRLIGDL